MPPFLGVGYDDGPEGPPRPRALGALREDERRERMGPVGGLRNTGVGLAPAARGTVGICRRWGGGLWDACVGGLGHCWLRPNP